MCCVFLQYSIFLFECFKLVLKSLEVRKVCAMHNIFINYPMTLILDKNVVQKKMFFTFNCGGLNIMQPEITIPSKNSLKNVIVIKSSP